MDNHVFLDIGLIIIVATLIGILAKRFRQPLIPAYIIAGLILGPGIAYLANTPFIINLLSLPANFNVIANNELISTLSEVGIALLLFIVGLEINLKSFKDVGKVTTYGALTYTSLIFGFGFILSKIFGFGNIESVYVALVFVFSSTMVVVKILSDRREIDTLHGKIIIGFLLIEDVIAILSLFILTTLSAFSFSALFITLFVAAAVITAVILLSDHLLPKLFKFVADSKDLLFLTALGVCFLFSLVFYSVGFSIAIGSFIGGIILGNLPYNFEIVGRIRSLRDFFSTLFFVSLGMQLELKGIISLLPFFLIALVVVSLVKPFLTMCVVGLFGYRKYTAFKVGTSLSQISEFSLILISQGMLLGYVSSDVFSIVVLLAIVTLTITTYTMEHTLGMYNKIKHLLGFLESTERLDETSHHYKKQTNEVILCGCDRMGRSILHKLIGDKTLPLVVDYNPNIIKKLQAQNIPAMYGDMTNEEVLEQINFKKAKILINTVGNLESSLTLIKSAKKLNKKLLIIDCASRVNEALQLYKEGADYVILPHFLSGDYVSFLLGKNALSNIHLKRKHHIDELKKHKDHFLEDRNIEEGFHLFS